MQGVNQKITTGAVRPQLGKRVLTCQNVAAIPEGEGVGALTPPSPHSGVFRGPSPLQKILRP